MVTSILIPGHLSLYGIALSQRIGCQVPASLLVRRLALASLRPHMLHFSWIQDINTYVPSPLECRRISSETSARASIPEILGVPDRWLKAWVPIDFSCHLYLRL